MSPNTDGTLATYPRMDEYIHNIFGAVRSAVASSRNPYLLFGAPLLILIIDPVSYGRKSELTDWSGYETLEPS